LKTKRKTFRGSDFLHEIILEAYEAGNMDRFLQDWGEPLGDPEDPTFLIMGMLYFDSFETLGIPKIKRRPWNGY